MHHHNSLPTTNKKRWTPQSWRGSKWLQQPSYLDRDALEKVVTQLSHLPSVVFADEVDVLRKELSKVEQGSGFILQGGDCAESFSEFSQQNVEDTVKVLLQMAVTLTYAGGCPVVKMGRIAGQFAKPRSSATEERDGERLPSYFGDSINGIAFTKEARQPDPQRMLQAYHQSVSTLNLLRALTTGGFASLRNVKAWNTKSVKDSSLNKDYGSMTERIHQALDFMEACGLPLKSFSSVQGTALYTSHEALLLEYEESMLRKEKESWYNLSAHCLWIGERTRALDSAHVELLRGVKNPIGIKLGPSITGSQCLELLERLNPENESGKMLCICRMGESNARQVLPELFRTVKKAGKKVIWVCDPMHGNTELSESGYKTRPFSKILNEITHFFEAHEEAGSIPGGLHLEMTGRYVTECTGGAEALEEQDLHHCYETQCDPRLNAGQSLEIAYKVAELLQHRRK